MKLKVKGHKSDREPMDVAIKNKTKINRYKNKNIPSASKMERLLNK